MRNFYIYVFSCQVRDLFTLHNRQVDKGIGHNVEANPKVVASERLSSDYSKLYKGEGDIMALFSFLVFDQPLKRQTKVAADNI